MADGDVTAIIENAMASASEGMGDIGDTGGAESVGDTGTEGVAETVPVVAAEAPLAAVVETKTAEVDALARELEEQGIKPPVEGQKENRIPYSRVKKILGNAQKKLTDQHTSAVTETTTKLRQTEEALAPLLTMAKLADADPDRYISELARFNPAYKKFLTPAAAPATPPKPQTQVSALGEMPKPDAKFADGSTGYSPEGFQKVLDWNYARAKQDAAAEAEAKFAERFGPIEKDYQQKQFEQQQTPIVNAQIAHAKQTWGKAFDDYQGEIMKALQANDGQMGRPYLDFHAAVASVLAPKQRFDAETSRTAMRGELIKELAGRPAAAQRTAPAAVAAGSVDAGPKSLEDIVRESIQSAGLR